MHPGSRLQQAVLVRFKRLSKVLLHPSVYHPGYGPQEARVGAAAELTSSRSILPLGEDPGTPDTRGGTCTLHMCSDCHSSSDRFHISEEGLRMAGPVLNKLMQVTA